MTSGFIKTNQWVKVFEKLVLVIQVTSISTIYKWGKIGPRDRLPEFWAHGNLGARKFGRTQKFGRRRKIFYVFYEIKDIVKSNSSRWSAI